MSGRWVTSMLIAVGMVLMTVLFAAVVTAGSAPALAMGARSQAEASESPSPSPIIPLPTATSASPSPSRSESPSASPTPTRSRRTASPNPVVTVIPAPVQSTAPPPSAAQLPPPPVDLGSDAGTPEPAETKKAVKATPKQPTDPLTRLVQFLLAAAVLLGAGGGLGLYLTRDTR